MTVVAQDEEFVAIRAVIAEADRLQSEAEGFTQLLTEDVALVNFGGRRVLGRDNGHEAMPDGHWRPPSLTCTRRTKSSTCAFSDLTSPW